MKMGRPRTIHVDRLALLAGISRATADQVAHLGSEHVRVKGLHEARTIDYARLVNLQAAIYHEQESIEAWGVVYDLFAFTGRELSPSERIRHQQAIRRLAADGVVELTGRRATRVRLTAAGTAALASRQPTEAVP